MTVGVSDSEVIFDSATHSIDGDQLVGVKILDMSLISATGLSSMAALYREIHYQAEDLPRIPPYLSLRCLMDRKLRTSHDTTRARHPRLTTQPTHFSCADLHIAFDKPCVLYPSWLYAT
jgi:hypothetical protein